jgi:hypothetical protein
METPAILDDARPPEVPRLVDVPTASLLLGGIGRSMTFELIASGQLESVKLGRRRLVLVSSVDALVERLRAVDDAKAA